MRYVTDFRHITLTVELWSDYSFKLTSFVLKYKILYEFNTSTNHTQLKDSNPSFIWPHLRLPEDQPDSTGIEDSIIFQNHTV